MKMNSTGNKNGNGNCYSGVGNGTVWEFKHVLSLRKLTSCCGKCVLLR